MFRTVSQRSVMIKNHEDRTLSEDNRIGLKKMLIRTSVPQHRYKTRYWNSKGTHYIGNGRVYTNTKLWPNNLFRKCNWCEDFFNHRWCCLPQFGYSNQFTAVYAFSRSQSARDRSGLLSVHLSFESKKSVKTSIKGTAVCPVV